LYQEVKLINFQSLVLSMVSPYVNRPGLKKAGTMIMTFQHIINIVGSLNLSLRLPTLIVSLSKKV